MDMNHNKKKPSPTKPFFTRFLDDQKLQEVTGGCRPPVQTLKFPSDNDEDVDPTT
jgi:hypothetical protein